jgi:transcriptional activator of cad operon
MARGEGEDTARIGPWRATRSTGRLEREGESRELEPKVMDLLFLLASDVGVVRSKDEIMAAIWPGVTVGDDALARCVFKLRQALGDTPRDPRFIETIPKRGYRLLPTAANARPIRQDRRRSWVALAAGVALTATATAAAGWSLSRPPPETAEAVRLIGRADDHYSQLTRADNEAATVLYRRVLDLDPGSARARAGLANAQVQRVIRWPGPPGSVDPAQPDLADALRSGRTRTPAAVRRLADARALAAAAAEDKPRDAWVLKALGLAASAQGDFAEAEAVYRRALKAEPSNWGVLINLGDILDIQGRPGPALDYLERAYEAMDADYARHAVRIRPWQAKLGVEIARRHALAGRRDRAEAWYRRVLRDQPFEPEATRGLADLQA